MSVLIGLRLGNEAVLATDSRIVDNTCTEVLSDAETKIFELSHGVRYGWSGYRLLAEPQVGIATKLSMTADMSDIRTFADRLDAMSQPLIERTLSALAEIRHLNPTKYGAELAGKKPFHAYVLAGVSHGKPGFLAREYWLTAEGHFALREIDGFNLPAGNDFAAYVTFGELLGDAVMTPETYARGPVAAVEGFVDRIRRAQPLVGGETQLARVDIYGCHWVHHPVALHPWRSPSPQLAMGLLPVGVVYAGTITATQVNSGTFSGLSLLLNSNGVLTSINNLTLPGLTAAAGLQVKLNSTGAFSAVSPTEMGVFNSSGTAFAFLNTNSVSGELFLSNPGAGTSLTVTPTSLVLFNGSINAMTLTQNSLSLGGNQVVVSRQSGPGSPSGFADSVALAWCRALYTALSTSGHGLIA